ncbi:MAG: hypothetical protein ACON5F_09265 [Jejuia sp.]
MIKKGYEEEFLPRELGLKLMRDLPRSNYREKINLVDNYVKTIKSTFGSTAFEVRYHNEIGFIYWDAEEYALAVAHYKKAITPLDPKDYSYLYFLIICFLIRGERHLKNYASSYKWVDMAFKNMTFIESSFEKLNILKEYADLLKETGEDFDYDTNIIMDIIEDLGFKIALKNPVETIHLLKQNNLEWNKKFGKIVLMKNVSKEEVLDAYKEFKKNCPIKYYRNLASEKIILLNGEL